MASMDSFEFLAVTNDGEILKCRCLFICGKPWTSGDVIVYTDNTQNEEGATRVYASRFNPDNLTEDNSDLVALEIAPLDEDDWETIEIILGLMQVLADAGWDEGTSSKAIGEIMSHGRKFAKELLEATSNNSCRD